MKLSENKSINQNAIANIIGLVVLNGVNFFTTPIFTHLLGAANYGAISIYNVWLSLVAIIVGLQIHGAIGQAKLYFTKEQYPKYLSSSLSFAFLSFLAVLAIVFVFSNPLSKIMKLTQPLLFLMVVNAFGSFCLGFATTTFTFAKQPFKTMGTSLISVLISVALSVFFIISTTSDAGKITSAIFGKAIPVIVMGLAFFIVFLWKGKTFFSREYTHFFLPLCLPLIFHSLSHMVLSQCDRIMLQYSVTAVEVGVYSFFVTFTHLLNAIWGAFNNTWVPFYYDDVKNDATELIKLKTKNYMYFFTTLTLGFMLLAPEVAKLFSTKEFWGGINLIPIMCGSMYMIFLYSFPVNFEFYHRRTKTIAAGTIGASILNIILNLIFISFWGNIGAAVATLISYIALFIFHQLMAQKIGGGRYHYSFVTFVKGIIAVAIGAVLFYTLIDLWYIRWGIGALLGINLLIRVIKQKSIF